MTDKEKKQVLRSIENVKEKFEKLKESVEQKLISESTYSCFKDLKDEVTSLCIEFDFRLDLDWRLAEEEFKEEWIHNTNASRKVKNNFKRKAK